MLAAFPRLSRRLILAMCLALLAAPALFASDSRITLRGHLDPKSVQASKSTGEPLTFRTEEGQNYQVAGDSVTNAQFRDPLLIDRLWELEGSLQPDGRFQIAKNFTIKDGKRYRVTYFCEICNIRTHEPGRCMCCQGPTELQELPAE